MHAARLTAVVVLPTPPFWLAIAYTVPMIARKLAAAAVGAGPGPGARSDTLASRYATERALNRHPRSAWKPIRGFAHLRHQVEVSVLSARIWPHTDGLDRLEPELGRGRRRGYLGCALAAPTPSREDTTDPK